MNLSDVPETEFDVRAYLASIDGQVASLDALTRRFKTTAKAMRFILNWLVQSGIIHQTCERKRSYFVPTTEQLAKMLEVSTMRPMRPLVVDKARHELNERIKAERDQIKSIG